LSLVNVVCCHVESLRRADHSSREALPSVVCPVRVIAKPLRERHDTELGQGATENFFFPDVDV
jgi:hypothetical protein